jgi:hypothetical protein
MPCVLKREGWRGAGEVSGIERKHSRTPLAGYCLAFSLPRLVLNFLPCDLNFHRRVSAWQQGDVVCGYLVQELHLTSLGEFWAVQVFLHISLSHLSSS